MVVTYGEHSYECSKAIKGKDYVHLLNQDGELTVRFEGIIDFSGFVISDGDWSEPTPEGECFLAVMGDDGLVRKGTHKCSDILSGALKSTESGTGVVVVDKVSKAEHLLDVKVSGCDTLRVCGRNMLNLQSALTGSASSQIPDYYPYPSQSESTNGLRVNITLEDRSYVEIAVKDYNDFIQLLDKESVTLSVRVPDEYKDIFQERRVELGVKYTDGTFSMSYANWGGTSCTHKFDHRGRTVKYLLVRPYSAGKTYGPIMDTETVIEDIQIEWGLEVKPYVPFQTIQEFNVLEDGTVDDIESISPAMTLMANTAEATIEVGYNRDLSEVIENAENQLADHKTQLDALHNDVYIDHADRLLTLEATDVDNDIRLSSVEILTGDHENRIAVQESVIDNHESRINNLENNSSGKSFFRATVLKDLWVDNIDTSDGISEYIKTFFQGRATFFTKVEVATYDVPEGRSRTVFLDIDPSATIEEKKEAFSLGIFGHEVFGWVDDYGREINYVYLGITREEKPTCDISIIGEIIWQ